MNRVICPTCQAKYRIDTEKINHKLNAQFRCKQCNNIFKVNLETIEQDNKPENTESSNQPVTEKQAAPYDTPPEKPFIDTGSANDIPDTFNEFELYESTMDFKTDIDMTAFPQSKTGFFGRLSLRAKFNSALIVIMLLSTAATFFYSDYRLNLQAERNVAAKGRLLLDTLEASRSFTSKVIKPALYKALPGQFIVEGMSSSFGARNIFERLQKKYPEFYFKHASPNPRNLVNIADKFEMSIINEKFKTNPDLKEWQGYRELNGVKEFVIMKPIVAMQRCLSCHSVPSKAPPEIIKRYGPKTGFGMKVGDVIAALTISVPATEIFTTARKNSIIFTTIVFICFILLTIVINIFFMTIVIKPINRLTSNVQEISVGKSDVEIDISGKDEISELAKGFDRMNTSIQLAMSKLRKS